MAKLEPLDKKLKEESLMLLILSNKEKRVNLINKLKSDRAFLLGFNAQLIKRGFRNLVLRNFFFNIIDYIESLACPISYQVKHQNDKIKYVFADCKSDYLADLFWKFRL